MGRPCSADGGERGLALAVSDAGFSGPVHCAVPLPLASDALGTVVVQHVGDALTDPSGLLAECARVLVPGGRLWLFALNPLTPYRWHWTGDGPVASEPITWRRRLRRAGLVPEPVSHGLGPRWRIEPDAQLQHGAGVRAAFLLRGDKRVLPLTPTRTRPSLRWQPGLPAA
jgi:SAM-dependent methyltransferase